MKRKNKGGFSLVEVVIALAIIVMVAGAGLSITLSSITTKVKAINRTHAQNFAENVLECFKAADTKDEFHNLLEVVDNPNDIHEERDDTTYYTFIHRSGSYQFVAEISVRYADGERPLLKVNVTDGEDGEEIISFPYEKGVTYYKVVAPEVEGGGNDA